MASSISLRLKGSAQAYGPPTSQNKTNQNLAFRICPDFLTCWWYCVVLCPISYCSLRVYKPNRWGIKEISSRAYGAFRESNEREKGIFNFYFVCDGFRVWVLDLFFVFCVGVWNGFGIWFAFGFKETSKKAKTLQTKHKHNKTHTKQNKRNTPKLNTAILQRNPARSSKRTSSSGQHSTNEAIPSSSKACQFLARGRDIWLVKALREERRNYCN